MERLAVEETREAYEAPCGEQERVIAECWSELFRLERIGRNDNFFALGGNSLTAMDLTDRMSERLGVEFTAVMLFLNPTPRQCAECLSTLEAD